MSISSAAEHPARCGKITKTRVRYSMRQYKVVMSGTAQSTTL